MIRPFCIILVTTNDWKFDIFRFATHCLILEDSNGWLFSILVFGNGCKQEIFRFVTHYSDPRWHKCTPFHMILWGLSIDLIGCPKSNALCACLEKYRLELSLFWSTMCNLSCYQENVVILAVVSLIFHDVRVVRKWTRKFLESRYEVRTTCLHQDGNFVCQYGSHHSLFVERCWWECNTT